MLGTEFHTRKMVLPNDTTCGNVGGGFGDIHDANAITNFF